MWMEITCVVMLGLCFGSLNTLLAYRLPYRKPIGMTRSLCPKCQHLLGVLDLVPVLSWLSTRGRCRYCHTSIHWRYPLTEGVTALVFIIVYLNYGLTLQAALIALLASQIVALCIIDLEHRIIPDPLQWGMGATGFTYSLGGFIHPADALVGAAVSCFCGIALQKGYYVIKKQHGLGTGDVKFMLVAGIWLGVSPLPPFFFYAGVYGVISALLWRLVSKDRYFPFGPALAVSLFQLVAFPESKNAYYRFPGWILTTLGII